MNRYTSNGFTRISKAQARKLWANDTAYYVCGPCAGRYLAYYVAEGVLPQ